MSIAQRTARITAATLIGATVLLVGTAPAGAHTAPVPVGIEPTPGSEHERVPDAIVLRFDSEFADDVSVSLIDPSGSPVEASRRVQGTTVTLHPDDPGALLPGTYRVAWEVQTTHPDDSPDGSGAESRQVHFYVGATSSGRMLVAPAAASSEAAGGGPAAEAWLPLAIGAVGVVLASTGGRRAGAVLIVVALATGGVLAVSDHGGETALAEAGPGPLVRSAVVDGDYTVRLDVGPQWVVQTTDPEGRPSPWATSAQLRFTDPDTGRSQVLDLMIDLDALGRLTSEPPAEVADWDAELVLSTFDGPVHNFHVSR